MTHKYMSTLEVDRQDCYILFLEKKEADLISKLGFKRVKTQKKVFCCEEGKIRYAFVYVRSPKGEIFSPLRNYLRLGKYENMSPEFRSKLVMKCSRTTYQKASEDICDSYGFKLSKKTLNRYVRDSAGDMEITTEPSEEQNILLADSTKVRNRKGGHHEVMAAMSLDYVRNESSLTAFGVNVQARDMAAKMNLLRYKAFVGDGDLALRNFFEDKIPFQLCHQHAINDVSFYLWKDGLSKKQREHLIWKFETIVYTLQNSTKRYWRTNKTGRLVNRIIRTKKCIRNLAAECSALGMHQAARYLIDHVEHMVTAARLALVGIKVPWTTNHAERLMQEMGIRTKRKGMSWTQNGLKAILNMVLKRYFLPHERRNYKEVFAQTLNEVVETN